MVANKQVQSNTLIRNTAIALESTARVRRLRGVAIQGDVDHQPLYAGYRDETQGVTFLEGRLVFVEMICVFPGIPFVGVW